MSARLLHVVVVVFICGWVVYKLMVEAAEDVLVLGVEEGLILRNVERMLETLLDEVDMLIATPTAAAQSTVSAPPYRGASLLQCPNCLQVNTLAQLKDGSCFVCGFVLTSASGV